MAADLGPVFFKQNPALIQGFHAAFPQACVAQHVPDRHSGRFEAAEKLDPYQDGRVVFALMGGVARRMRQQPDPFIIADGVS